jgi:hypothetical protein
VSPLRGDRVYREALVSTWTVEVEIVDLDASDLVQKVVGRRSEQRAGGERVVAVPVEAPTPQAASQQLDAFLIASGLMTVTAIRRVLGL